MPYSTSLLLTNSSIALDVLLRLYPRKYKDNAYVYGMA
jgi:hypothetical protein